MTRDGRALVLGAGGVTGIAWEVGVLAGLAAAGMDLRSADVVVGTSAGSVVGAQTRSEVSWPELYAAQADHPGSEISARIGVAVMLRLGWAWVRYRDEQQARARIGRMALAARTAPEATRREVIAARLPLLDWPGQRLLITAVDAASGEFQVFDSTSGVALADAVAASCAVPLVWPPVTIGARRFIDGGMRSPANVDLAADCARIVVIAPLTQGARRSASVARQVAALSGQARVLTVVPDQAARAAMGRNPLDPRRRAPAARAGWVQAAALVPAVRAVWGS